MNLKFTPLAGEELKKHAEDGRPIWVENKKTRDVFVIEPTHVYEALTTPGCSIAVNMKYHDGAFTFYRATMERL